MLLRISGHARAQPGITLLFSSNPAWVRRSCTTWAPCATGETGGLSSNVTSVGGSPLPVTSKVYDSSRGGSLRRTSPFQRTAPESSTSVTFEPVVHWDSILPQFFLSTSGLVSASHNR